MEFGLLGPLQVRDGDRHVVVSAPRQRVLLAALLVKAGRVVAFDELAKLYGNDRQPGGRGALHSAVQRLRDTLGRSDRELIHTRPAGYVMEPGVDELDIRRFELLSDRGEAAARAGRQEEAADTLRQALGLWRGDPLADVPSQPLRDREVPQLIERRMRVLSARIDADLSMGRHEALVPELTRLAAEHPLRERLQAQLIIALYRSGRQAEALATYQDVRRVLLDELGIEPGADLRELQQSVLAGDRGPMADQPPALPAHPAGAPARVLVVPRQLPVAVPHFTGRLDEMAALTGLLDETAGTGGTVISAISGTAGVGKTALAVHWAHQVAARFPDGQLYVNLRGFDPSGEPVTATEALHGFLEALAIPAGQVPASTEAKASLYRSLLADRRMLIVLDNARDAAQVRPLLPGTAGCLVLVTSRRQLAGLAAAEGAHLVGLDVLTEADARELLGRRLGPARLAGEPQAATDLTGLCERLPLALSVAAARAATRPGFPLAGLAAELHDTASRLDALNAGDAAASVRAVFSWSYRDLAGPAARMFRLMGLHPGPDISVPAAASLAGIPRQQARECLRELVGDQLLTEHAPGRFALHDLLRAYAAEQARGHDSDTERRAATDRMLDHYLHTAHAANQLLNRVNPPLALAPVHSGTEPEDVRDDGQALAWFETEYPVLLAVTALAARTGPDPRTWQIPWVLASFLNRRGRWHDMVSTQGTALAAAQRLADPAGQAHAHHYLGRACVLLGRYDEADAHLTAALTAYRELDDAANQARVHGELGRAFELQGRHRTALEHAELGLGLFRAAGHQAGQANALNAVGWYHCLLGDHRQAIAHCEQALTLLRGLGDRHSEAATWDSLGYAHHNLGQYTDAISCYRKALDLREHAVDRFDEARILVHLGDACHTAGDRQAARDAWQRALVIFGDLHHPEAGHVRGRLRGLPAIPGAAAP